MTLKVLISGAGIAGLALARQLQSLQIPYTLIERNDVLRAEGLAVALPANAIAALKYMGLADNIMQQAHQVQEVIYTKPTGKLLSRASLLQAPLDKHPFVALERSKLHETLATGVDSIHFNSTITAIEQFHDRVEVKFDSLSLPEHDIFDVVVGADGLHSNTRKMIFGDDGLKDFSIYCCRWLCEHSTAALQPTFQLGPHDAFMTYPIGLNKVYCYAHVVGENSCLKNSADYQAALKQAFARYRGIASEMLAIVPRHEDIVAGKVYSVAKPYFSKGRVALIGDANSACSPILQQGVACGLEDAIVLSGLLAQAEPRQALSLYKDYRQHRVAWIMKTSDRPLKNLTRKQSALMVFAKETHIRLKGPLNIQGWKKLLSEDYLASITDCIAKC